MCTCSDFKMLVSRSLLMRRKLFESGDRGGAETLEVILLGLGGLGLLAFYVVNVFIFETQLWSFYCIIYTKWITHRLCSWPAFLPSDVCVSESLSILHLKDYSTVTCCQRHHELQSSWKVFTTIQFFLSPPHFLVFQPYFKIDYIMHMCSV